VARRGGAAGARTASHLVFFFGLVFEDLIDLRDGVDPVAKGIEHVFDLLWVGLGHLRGREPVSLLVLLGRLEFVQRGVDLGELLAVMEAEKLEILPIIRASACDGREGAGLWPPRWPARHTDPECWPVGAGPTPWPPRWRGQQPEAAAGRVESARVIGTSFFISIRIRPSIPHSKNFSR